MDSVIIVAGIVFMPENTVSNELIAYHRGDCCDIKVEAESLGYKFKAWTLEEGIRKYTIIKKD